VIDLTLDEPRQAEPHALPLILRHELLDAAAAQRLDRYAVEPTRRGVDVHDLPGGRDDEDRIGRAFEEVAEAMLGLARGALRLAQAQGVAHALLEALRRELGLRQIVGDAGPHHLHRQRLAAVAGDDHHGRRHRAAPLDPLHDIEADPVGQLVVDDGAVVGDGADALHGGAHVGRLVDASVERSATQRLAHREAIHRRIVDHEQLQWPRHA